MKIAIIGAGNVGRALTASASRAGHEVTVSAAHTDHAVEAARAKGARPASSNRDAVKDAEVVILAVPGTAYAELGDELGDTLAGKIVVDVANRPTPNPSGNANSIAEELQQLIPQARVVKAFNTAFASRQARPEIGGQRADGYVAADDEEAKAKVLTLVESIGFRPVDAGPLAAARTLEGMAWLNISRNMQGGSWQSAWVLADAA